MLYKFIQKAVCMKKEIILFISLFFLAYAPSNIYCEYGSKIILRSKALFELSESRISSSEEAALNEVAALLSLYPDNVIIIEGHADSTGEKKSNQKLSEARAQSVYDFFVLKGIKKERMRVIGYGDKKPVGDNADENSRKQNRRAEILILKSE